MLDQGIVLENQLQGAAEHRIHRMVLKTEIARHAVPGQFVHVKVREGLEPLLRRPLSISAIDAQAGTITIFYRLHGQGTAWLTKVKEGECVDLLGPLGRGFSLPESGEELWLVAGGIGIFPLYALAMAAKNQAGCVKLYWGGENTSFLQSAGLQYWQDLGVEIILTTMDGSQGKQGLVTSPLLRGLDTYPLGERKLTIAACGPTAMLKAVAGICEQRQIPCEVSLEERMACGVGACLGCSCVLKNSDGSLKRARVCKDGPIFNGKEVVWNELSAL